MQFFRSLSGKRACGVRAKSYYLHLRPLHQTARTERVEKGNGESSSATCNAGNVNKTVKVNAPFGISRANALCASGREKKKIEGLHFHSSVSLRCNYRFGQKDAFFLPFSPLAYLNHQRGHQLEFIRFLSPAIRPQLLYYPTCIITSYTINTKYKP